MPWQLDKRVPRAAFWILGPLEMSLLGQLMRALLGLQVHIYIYIYIYIYIHVYRCVYIFVFFLALLHRCLEVLCRGYWCVCMLSFHGFRSIPLQGFVSDCIWGPQPKPQTLNNSKPETLKRGFKKKTETLTRAWVMLWDNGCRLAWLFLERAARAAGQGRAQISDRKRTQKVHTRSLSDKLYTKRA